MAAGTSLVWQHLTNKPAGSHRVTVQAWFIIERLNLKKKKKCIQVTQTLTVHFIPHTCSRATSCANTDVALQDSRRGE